MKTDHYEILDLAISLLGMDEDNDPSELDIEDALIEKFNIDISNFHYLVEALLQRTPVVVSPLTNTFFHAFMDDTGTFALVKQPAYLNVGE